MNIEKLQKNGLHKIFLYDSYIPNTFTELDFAHGNTYISGGNGDGKTSTLKLIPIFYGARPDRLIDRAANKLSFVDFYLPNSRSMIVYEYMNPTGLCCVVFYRNSSNDGCNYRFIQGAARETIFLDRFIDFHKECQSVKKLTDELFKSDIM